MARKSKKRGRKKLTRKQLSRLEREERIRKLLILGVTLVGIAVVGVLGYGLVVEQILEPRQPVAVVDDEPVTSSEFQARVRFRRLQMQNQLQYLYQQQQQTTDTQSANAQSFLQYIQGQIRDIQSQLEPENAETIGKQVLDQLIQEELVRQEASSRGISVTSDEVEEKIQDAFGYNPDAAPEPTVSAPLTSTGTVTTPPSPVPTQMTKADFRDMYNRYIRESLRPMGISEQLYRTWIEAELLTERLQADIEEKQVPAEADQVKLRLLTVDSEERANELAARLDAGEDFQTLADELKQDQGVQGSGNELGWLPRELLENRLGKELTDLAFSLEVGERSQPLAGEEGQQYRIVLVAGHEVRELDKFVRQQMVDDAFQAWLDAQLVLVERKTYRDRIPTEP